MLVSAWPPWGQNHSETTRMVMRDGQLWDTERSDGQDRLVLPQEGLSRDFSSRGLRMRPDTELGARLVSQRFVPPSPPLRPE
jgi:hypothetical protein